MQPTERVRQVDKDPSKDPSKEPMEKGQTRFDLLLASFQRLLRRGAITNLGKMLARLHPAEIAKVIAHLSSPKGKRTVFELVRGGWQGGQVLREVAATIIQRFLAYVAS